MTSLAVKSLLLISAGANAALAFSLWGPAKKFSVGPSAAAMAVVRKSSSTENPNSNAPTPRATEADRALIFESAARYGRSPALGDPKALAEQMYRDGYPGDVITSVVSRVLTEWYGEAALQKAAREGDATARALNKAIGTGGGAMARYRDDIFPHVGAANAADKARERELRFGAMAQEKILEIERVEQELKWGLNNGLQSPWDSGSKETKVNEALSEFLTTEELASYWRFNSSVARHLQDRIEKITVDEATYDRLLAAATEHHRSTGGRGDMLGSLRGILPDHEFLQLVGYNGYSGDLGPADKIYQAAGLSEAKRSEFYALAAGIIFGGAGESPQAAQTALEQIRATLGDAPDAVAQFERGDLAAALRHIAQKR